MTFDIDPFGTWANALPSDVKKKLSLHDLKRIWHGAKDVLRHDREPSGATTNDAPIVPREPTEAMLTAGILCSEPLSTAAIWRAMHDAATEAATSESCDDG